MRLYTLLVSVLRCWETSQEIARVTLVDIHGEHILHTVFSLDYVLSSSPVLHSYLEAKYTPEPCCQPQ